MKNIKICKRYQYFLFFCIRTRLTNYKYKPILKTVILIFFLLLLGLFSFAGENNPRFRLDFNESWKFCLCDPKDASKSEFDDTDWRNLDLPHDWSIEGNFSKDHPTKVNGGALPAGIGWYRKSFVLPKELKGKQVYIEFDGVYRNSEVWINGHYLGKRAYGYSSFFYDLTRYLNPVDKPNVLSVRVDNSLQPNSRWYTGSGIYRNVWLTGTSNIFIDHWGTFITSKEISSERATINLTCKIRNHQVKNNIAQIQTFIFDAEGKEVCTGGKMDFRADSLASVVAELKINHPRLWSIENPNQYNAVTKVYQNGQLMDQYTTPFGIRSFRFDPSKGFFLNGKPLKILGVNLHHDAGALGAVVNVSAMRRQLKLLKEMGCNAIRLAHNPVSPEMLDLCDGMGFIVMEEAFDCWAIKKMDQDYHTDWKQWHAIDLKDMIIRDRNHPSIFIWSIGNEIREQFDSTGIRIGKELAGIVKQLDSTRPVTCGLTEQDPAKNFIYQSKALDLISFNYKQKQYADFPKNYPGECLLAAENISAYMTRGHYDMPSDSIRVWPEAYDKPLKANPDLTASAYDNAHAYWGSTHEETWKIIKNSNFVAGTFIWSGFDFLGEPEPYKWPARSSYYGILDLAGFPKDIYYFYQSEWTQKPVLHLFPHWNWTTGQTVDVWAYFNNADEVELFLNGQSQGIRKKTTDLFHALWRVKYLPGTLKAISRKGGTKVLETEIHTAGKPAKIELLTDRTSLKTNSKELAYITVRVTDEAGNLVPDAGNLINFKLNGSGTIAGVDNGCQTSMEPFKAKYRKAFNGMCLVIAEAGKQSGDLVLEASSEGLKTASISLKCK